MPKFGKYERDDAYGYACGIFPSMELLKHRADTLRALLIRPEGCGHPGVTELIEQAQSLRVPIHEAARAIERVSGKENCYAAAVFEKYQDKLETKRSHIVLHNISDMGNFGTIVRTCLGFDYADIAMIRPCVDPFAPKAVRASMGAIFGARIALFDSFEAYRAQYPDHQAYYFRLHNACDLYTIHPHQRSALVFGNEGSGLPEELSCCDIGVKIMHGELIDSLNLSVAVGIGVSYFHHKQLH